MLKSIPKSNISKKKFPVYKEWTQTQNDSPVLVAYNETSHFDEDTSTKSDGIYVSPLWNSTRTKYFTSNGDVFIQHGVVRNPATFTTERPFSDTVYIIRVPRIKIGEQIKKGSIEIEDLDNGKTYTDNGFGGITTESPVFTFISYDIETQSMFFRDDFGDYDITLSTFDLNTGIGTFTYNMVTGDFAVIQVDFQTGLVSFSESIAFGGAGPEVARIGNVFYDEGIIVLSESDSFTNYNLTYRSTVMIHETEVLVSVEKGEFNYSQNPSAIDISLFSSSSFQTTAIPNRSSAKTLTIKEINDISRKRYFYGSVGSNVGTWEDYFESGSSDPTGSYLAPYITTIGLYDDNCDIIAVAKLPKPIKNLPDWNVNILIRIDT